MMQRFIPVLLIALLAPGALAAAAPDEPSAALSFFWDSEKAACTESERDGALTRGDEEGAQVLVVQPGAPFAQRQEKGGNCPFGACDDFCYELCGGFPYGQCLMTREGTCRAICCCPPYNGCYP